MSILFTPIRVQNIEIRNRLVLPAMNTRQADLEGFVTERTINYYTERGSHGVGLVIVEMCSPEVAGRHRAHELGMYDDRFLPGLKRLARAIKDTGAKACIQLGHGGGHTREEITGQRPIAPSAVEHVVREKDVRRIIPLEMDGSRILQTVQSFADGAIRARKAGFDAIELHGGHGYLIFQFLSPLDNVRTDEYGGSLRNRARFAIQVLTACRKAVPDFPIIFRMSLDEYAPGGFTAEEGVQVAQWVAEAGADVIHVSAGSYRSQELMIVPPMIKEPGIFLPLAHRVKKKVNIPVIAVGRLNDPALAEGALSLGYADMIAVGRGLIADPEWLEKVHQGTPEAIRVCLACNTCGSDMQKGKTIGCVVNPWAGREKEIILSPVKESKKVLVGGGGPAGLEAARILSQRGYKVTLAERNPLLGGSLRLAMKAPLFQEVDLRPSVLEKFIEYQIGAARSAGTEILSSTPLDEKLIDRLRPDIVVLATGSSYRFPLNFIFPFLLKSGLVQTSFFKRMLQRIHESPSLHALFFKTLRKSDLRVVSLLKRKRLKFYVVGDCQQPGMTQETLLSAAKIAADA
jgi:2,4-dienoyl-CoA reductase-like NADH-dependent reductase (Old Yellow Enzyme family)